MNLLDIGAKRITVKNIEDIICCPGGLEVRDDDFSCDISPVLRWRKEMLKSGLRGFIFYRNEEPRGFLEYMPVERAPYPIKGEDVAVIMCYHWIPPHHEKNGHHSVEKKMLKSVIEEIRSEFTGVTALAWDHPIHFPKEMFEDIGFFEIRSTGYISFMWNPFQEGADRPSLIGPNFDPTDLSNEGKLAVECGYSNRCAYSINDLYKVKKVISDLDHERIIFKEYRIDTRDQAIEFSKEPWTWDWLFLNGDEIDHMKKDEKELKTIIVKKLEEVIGRGKK